MAYRKKKTTTTTRRRTYGRRMMKKRWRRKPKYTGGMTSFVTYDRWQPAIQGTVATTVTDYAYTAVTFQMTDLNSTDVQKYIDLFQFYRINTVTVRFRLRSNPNAVTTLNSGTTTNMNFYPDIYIAVDHNDSQTPTGPELFLQQGDKVKVGLLKPDYWVYYRFHPTPQTLMYSGLVSAYSIQGKKNPWINTDNTAVPHYGLKWMIGMPLGAPFSSPLYYEIQYRYNVSFKGNQ